MTYFIKFFMTLSLILTLAACGVSEDTKESRETALSWTEARMEWDGDQRMKLLTPKAKEKYKDSMHARGEAVDPKAKVTKYKMKEWKISEDFYVYFIEYLDEGEFKSLWTQTKRTDQGWGITDMLTQEREVAAHIEGIEPTIIKEMGQ